MGVALVIINIANEAISIKHGNLCTHINADSIHTAEYTFKRMGSLFSIRVYAWEMT